jgi:hypothetical protein
MRPMALPAAPRRATRNAPFYRPLRAPIRRTPEPWRKIREFWIAGAGILLGLSATWLIISVGFWLTNR